LVGRALEVSSARSADTTSDVADGSVCVGASSVRGTAGNRSILADTSRGTDLSGTALSVGGTASAEVVDTESGRGSVGTVSVIVTGDALGSGEVTEGSVSTALRVGGTGGGDAGSALADSSSRTLGVHLAGSALTGLHVADGHG
jgi:hypothetical protein